MLKRRTFKTVTVIVIILMMMTSMATITFAADSYKTNVYVTTVWKDIATSTTGFNKTIRINYLGTVPVGLGILKADIRMLSSSGSVLWSQNQVCASGGQDFWCGSDVYTVQIKVLTGTASASSYPK